MNDRVHRWSTPLPGGLALLGVGIALGVGSWASHPDRPAMFVLAVAAIGAAAVGLIALLRRPRLVVGPGAQLRVGTLRGPTTLTPADTQSVELLGTRRLAFRSQQLLIEDTAGHLMVFGRWDLGENPAVVFSALAAAGFPVTDRTVRDAD
ncbi:MAG: PH domain-containing protein [Gordonia sp. (in: high G+C Gram-positive bacteria)]|uniref:PH domain-containing protein n=1 Tax=Gordonia sp. (in: high G+C Gram-positive bacteria) TaxID=84139 RepID=UPI003BB5FF5C